MISRRSAPVLSTYQRARLQVVAYRTIQSTINGILSGHELNTTQWIMLGWLHDHPDGMRVTALADILDVETPLVTTLIGPLQAKELIISVPDKKDKRAKLLTLSPGGEELVSTLEDTLQNQMKFYEQGFKKHELETYFSTLEKFINNAKQQPK